MIDRVFGKQQVIALGGKNRHGTFWLCRCVCGTERNVQAGDLERGISRSCGCWKSEFTRIAKTRNNPPAKRFWLRVDKNGPIPEHMPHLGPCWVWTGGTTGKRCGRGRISIKGEHVLAPHLAWFLETGAWPTLWVLHKCDNSLCVRFTHLFEGTHQDNTDDMVQKGRTAHLRGEDSGTAKLTWAQAEEIRMLYATGNFTTRELARKFGLASKTSISYILKGEQWKT